MDIAQGQVGPEAKYSLKFEGGKLVAVAQYDGVNLDVDVQLKFDAMQVVDALIDVVEKAVPGDQKALAEMLKSAVKAVA